MGLEVGPSKTRGEAEVGREEERKSVFSTRDLVLHPHRKFLYKFIMYARLGKLPNHFNA
jgi:hypothetical protein